MRIYRSVAATLVCCLGLWAGVAQAQVDIQAQIQKTATKPVIDGLGKDAVWAAATAHGMDEFFGGDSLEGPDDLDVTWKALWDDQNLYVLIDVKDDEIVTEDSCSWEDDSVEIYLDAQNLDVEEFNNVDVPAYQLTALAGFADDSVCSRLPYGEFEQGSKSWFTHGINSYDTADETTTRYPQGTDESRAVISDAKHYSFEVSFPWTSLEDTPANIIKRGSMGFGIGINDDDDGSGRDTQPIWGTEATDLWHRSDTMPSVALSTQVVGGGGGVKGDFDGDKDVDAADIDALSAAVRASSTDTKFDLTGDGKVNDGDRANWVEVTKKTYFGDSNLDGEFNSGDFVTVFTVGKYENGSAANWAEGDWNGDNLFNSSDFVAAFSAGGYENGPRAAVSSVPEPASTTLVLLGISAIALRTRRRV